MFGQRMIIHLPEQNISKFACPKIIMYVVNNEIILFGWKLIILLYRHLLIDMPYGRNRTHYWAAKTIDVAVYDEFLVVRKRNPISNEQGKYEYTTGKYRHIVCRVVPLSLCAFVSTIHAPFGIIHENRKERLYSIDRSPHPRKRRIFPQKRMGSITNAVNSASLLL